MPRRLRSLPARTRRTARPALAAAAVAVLALTAACGSGSSDPSSTGTPAPSASGSAAATPSAATPSGADPSAAPSGSSSAAPAVTTGKIADVKVSGAKDKAPTVSFPTPFGVAKTTAKTVTEGTGPVVKKGESITVNYTGVIGRTGKSFDSSVDAQFKHVGATDFTLVDGKLIPGFISGLVGQKVGSRVLIAIPPADGYGSGGNGQAGIEGTDTLVFVVDIDAIAPTPLPMATGTAVTPPASLPKVTVAKGIPTAIAKGPGAAPKAPVTQVLIRGNGKKLTATGNIKVQALVSVWRTGKTATSTWTSGQGPVPLQLGGTGVPPAFKGLIGQPVGSRVMIVSTPPTGVQPNADVTAQDSLVYVFDILAAS